MDNNKILFVNLSKGKTGELNSQLLGMMFVMKFQVAAMSRADMPEDERKDFALYVDEFQNFATDSFESILSEARKYRLNLILANQFMTQLTDTIREAILGNIGTIISGRIGVTDAELLQKKFQPTFDVEDLTKLPNYQAITSVMISGVPSSAFSMTLVPSMGESRTEIREALKKLSAVKYGRPRAIVEKEIFARLGAGERFLQEKAKQVSAQRPGFAGAPNAGAPASGVRTSSGRSQKNVASATGPAPSAPNKSFLDEWLERRSHIQAQAKPATGLPPTKPAPEPVAQTVSKPVKPADRLDVRDSATDDDSFSVSLR